MSKKYTAKKIALDTKSQKERQDYRQLSRQASAFERFSGEFADTNVSYQNVGGFILPLQVA